MNCYNKFSCRNEVSTTFHHPFLLYNIHPQEWTVGDLQSEPTESIEERALELKEKLKHFRKVNGIITEFVGSVPEEVSKVLDHSVDCLDRGEMPVWDFSVLDEVQEAMTKTLNGYTLAVQASLSSIRQVLEHPFLPRSSAPCLYAIQSDALTCFDCSRRTWLQKRTLLSPVITRGAWDLVLNTAEPQIFHTGGEGPVNTVQIIYGKTGYVEAKEAMKSARKEHCALEAEGWVYVFGGRDSRGKLDSAERYSLEKEEWEELPHMLRKRFKFNPVYYQGYIMLPGGCDKTIECLQLESCTFFLLPLELSRESPCLTVLLPSCFLLTFTLQSAHYWHPNATTPECVDSGIYNLSFYTAPVFYEDHIYFLDYQLVKALSADALDQTQEYRLTC